MTRVEAIRDVKRIRKDSARYDMLDPDFVLLLEAAELLSHPSSEDSATRWAVTGYTNHDDAPFYRCACCGRLTTMPEQANPSLCHADCAAWTGELPNGGNPLPEELLL